MCVELGTTRSTTWTLKLPIEESIYYKNWEITSLGGCVPEQGRVLMTCVGVDRVG